MRWRKAVAAMRAYQRPLAERLLSGYRPNATLLI
jgi:hypothetical protein